MGKIWLQTTDGRLIHLPVVGDDVNTPDDPVKIPTAVLTTEDRCLSGQITVAAPGYGNVIFDFDPPGRTGGPCSQCGQCCTHPIAACPEPDDCHHVLDTTYNIHKCQYLTIKPGAGKLGKSDGTECSLRAEILDRFKGCTLGPDAREPHMTSCTFVFPGE
jgi:hypothetical protein